MNGKDIAIAISFLRPNAVFNVRGNALSGIEWLDEGQSRPTDDEITAQIG